MIEGLAQHEKSRSLAPVRERHATGLGMTLITVERRRSRSPLRWYGVEIRIGELFRTLIRITCRTGDWR
jgi:hypothetical protein